MTRRFSLELHVAGAVAVLALSGCGTGERKASAQTPVASAEVETKMPRGALSDQQLQAAADQAVRLASTQSVPVTVAPAGPADGAANATTGDASKP